MAVDPTTAPSPRPADRRTGMVMVACKAPNGIVLNLDHYEKTGETPLSIRRVKGPATVTLNGWARKFGDPDVTEGGYRLTAVPAEFWEAWYKVNSKNTLITDRIILPPHVDASGQAQDHKSIPQMFRPAVAGDKSADRFIPGVEIGERPTP